MKTQQCIYGYANILSLIFLLAIGSNNKVCAQVWSKLQGTNLNDVRVVPFEKEQASMNRGMNPNSYYFKTS